ncbi:MAG: hypothetical protein CSA15_03260 [Candidatus Delongbacteria bacterium]|nr:MAG: hypothetical protein CSA15_03260 [Candidatus Delongbacteria bacterium]
MEIIKNKEYIDWLKNIKYKVRTAQIKTALVANRELILFYWNLGHDIFEKQKKVKWGDKLLDQLSIDLKLEFPNIKGLSKTNLKYCLRFYQFYAIGQQPVDQLPNNENGKVDESQKLSQHLVDQIPWGHNIQIFTKSKTLDQAKFYIKQTIENGWSRDVLVLQIKSDLYQRQGKGITNFKNTLPHPQSDLATQTIKDPYTFDFLSMTEPYNEQDIELKLVENLSKFLLELGKGFAFVGRQYHLVIDESDYYLDLLFYHTRLKCYVVIELKNTRFKPEYAGKLNFYLSAVDSLVKADDDKPTIGILLCRDKKKIETEFALRGISKPIGVSEFTLTDFLPESLKSDLPTIEELESKFNE